jgi:hypothetical protein
MRRRTRLAAIAAALTLAISGAAVAAGPLIHIVIGLGPIGSIDIGILYGPFQQTNSKDGQAVLVAENLVPGQTRTGEVKITSVNRPGTFELQASGLSDEPGPFGGVLSSRLRVRVLQVGAGGSATPLYDGTLAGLHTVALGRLDLDEQRTYRFEVTLPSGGTPSSPTTGDNAFQGARAKVTLTWVGADALGT